MAAAFFSPSLTVSKSIPVKHLSFFFFNLSFLFLSFKVKKRVMM